jgi:hypothetical protein
MLQVWLKLDVVLRVWNDPTVLGGEVQGIARELEGEESRC